MEKESRDCGKEFRRGFHAFEEVGGEGAMSQSRLSGSLSRNLRSRFNRNKIRLKELYNANFAFGEVETAGK